MTDATPHDIAARFLAGWNETDPARRRSLVAALWAEEATFRDPLAQAAGHDGIDALMGGVQDRFPGFCFALSGRAPERCGDCLRLSWNLGAQGEPAVAEGTDFIVLDHDGRFRTVTGFLDRVPVAA